MELMGEVGDVQADCGQIWINEVEMIVITELDEYLWLLGLISGGGGRPGKQVAEQTVGVGGGTGDILE